jgi:hypothetical protein
MFQQQAVELDHNKRAAILQKMQQLAYERSICAPIWLLGFLNGAGPFGTRQLISLYRDPGSTCCRTTTQSTIAASIPGFKAGSRLRERHR